jgi:tRNA modification GTPase
MDALLTALSSYAKDYFAATESIVVTRARHRRALEETVAALDRASTSANSKREELIAEELRSAATTLGRLTGRVDVEDILDVIFRDFCIGK